jgi:hypothetical protein
VTVLDLVVQESWPTGAVRERTQAQGDACLVLRTEVDTRRETRMLDALERANRRAMTAWLASGRSW